MTISSIITSILAALTTVAVYFGIYAPEQPIGATGGTQLSALQTLTLSGAGVSSTATSITLSTLKLTQTGQKLKTADITKGDTPFYITLEPGNKSRQEIVSCTGVTQNTNDTATLTGCTRGLSPISPYTASTTLRFTHAGGTQIVFGDPPQVFNKFSAKDNRETITGQWRFLDNAVFFATSVPYFTSAPTFSSSTQIVSKGYVDGVAVAGAPDSSITTKGILELAEGVEAARGDAAGSGDTTAPLTLHTAISTSTRPGNDATTTVYYVPVTQASGFLDPGFLSYASTSQSALRQDELRVIGNALLGATTTTGALNATNTIHIGTTTAGAMFEVGGDSVFKGPVSIGGNLDIQGTCNGCTSTSTGLLSFGPMPPTVATNTVETAITTNTDANYFLFNLPGNMTVASTSFYITAPTTPGTFDIGIYTGDGSTLLTQGTTNNIAVTGVHSMTFSPAVTLGAGTYYWAIVPNGTANASFISFQYSNYGDCANVAEQCLYALTGEPAFSLEQTVTAGTLPASFDTTAANSLLGSTPMFRLHRPL